MKHHIFRKVSIWWHGWQFRQLFSLLHRDHSDTAETCLYDLGVSCGPLVAQPAWWGFWLRSDGLCWFPQQPTSVKVEWLQHLGLRISLWKNKLALKCVIACNQQDFDFFLLTPCQVTALNTQTVQCEDIGHAFLLKTKASCQLAFIFKKNNLSWLYLPCTLLFHLQQTIWEGVRHQVIG